MSPDSAIRPPSRPSGRSPPRRPVPRHPASPARNRWRSTRRPTGARAASGRGSVAGLGGETELGMGSVRRAAPSAGVAGARRMARARAGRARVSRSGCSGRRSAPDTPVLKTAEGGHLRRAAAGAADRRRRLVQPARAGLRACSRRSRLWFAAAPAAAAGRAARAVPLGTLGRRPLGGLAGGPADRPGHAIERLLA